MSTESVSRSIADTVTISRELREEGQIDGQVKLYNVEEGDEFESDADTFFERTLMTQGLREAFIDLRDTLRGDENYGTYVLYGPYGSGKSHQMVAMYHCFASPSVAGEFADSDVDGFSDALPSEEESEAVTVSLQQRQPDYLWEPFFDVLGYEPTESDLQGYPDMETIQEAVNGQTVAYLMDELEDWFATLTGDQKARNRGFLQALLETADLEDSGVYAIVSVLRRGSEVHNILDRERASQLNMSNKVSKEDVIRHRLIDDVDHDAVDDIVDGYLQAYSESDHVPDSELPSGLADDMRDTYPFHPVLLSALETRYYADEGNQNTRGMIYLFSKILTTAADPEADPDDEGATKLIEQTDLITHGDVDTILFADELTRINFARPNVCRDDIENRVDPDSLPYGRRILNTVLLYSLKPDEGEGATTAEIVMGVYETDDLVADIVLDIEQLHGTAWYFHKLNGKYAVRDEQTPGALIQNKATEVDRDVALGEVADAVESVFGSRAHPVGFVDGDFEEVPDGRQIKVVVNSEAWTRSDIDTVIKNAGGTTGRQWRNALVYVQPVTSDDEDEDDGLLQSGRGYVEKAKYIVGAQRVLDDDSIGAEIEDDIRRQRDNERSELEDRIELAYGEVLDTDDVTQDLDEITQMNLEVYVGSGHELDAEAIVDSAGAAQFDLGRHVWPIVEDLFDRRGEASFEDIHEQFLRQPEYPIPGSPNDVLNAAVDALEDKPVITHGSNGFSDSLEGSSLDTVVLPEEGVERWDTDNVIGDLRRRFGSGETSIDVGNYELELLEDREIWLEGDGHDTVMAAVGRLAQEDQYVLYSGSAIVTKARSDATLRDISDAEVVGRAEVSERIQRKLDANGRADTSHALDAIRSEESIYLSDDETAEAFRSAVTDFLVEDHVIEEGGEYADNLEERDPTDVVIVPTVPGEVRNQIIEYIDGLDEGDEFTVGSVADRFDDSVSEDAVQTFLLRHLGRGDEAAYVLASDNSEDPTRWSPGYPFQVPGEEGWSFAFDGDDVTALRTAWRTQEEPGEVSYGEVWFTLAEDPRIGVPGPLQGRARISETRTKLTIEEGEPHTAIRDMFEGIPEDATDIDVEIYFE